MKKEWQQYTIPALALFVLFAFFSKCQRDAFNEAKTALLEQNTGLDSALAQREQRIALLQTEREQERRAKEAAQDSSAALLAFANRLRASRARVLVPVPSNPNEAPTASDTVRAVSAALENCEGETVVLRQAVHQDSTALANAAREQAALAGELALTKTSLTASEAGRRDLVIALRKAEAPCSILWGIRCPSRTQTAVVVFVGTVFAVKQFSR